ncbi:hypothetical protein Lbir_2620 [Legionella birminghamensis]|uniref:Uncharacterized protein n=1 Tax=Legionella birminghamensis TaxID=28083 RepID=A0A378I8A5_9GAMM|nr:hypothetical protein [Legionella birminghamensis]KTC68018.1 hypothetical protein Lbir_2620 [Legionella birminghamensis]STX31273.1 Uncharacterised protein [Legionella birminghamensis]
MPGTVFVRKKEDFNLRSQKKLPVDPLKPEQANNSLSYEAYCAELLADATHINSSSRTQKYSGAQFEIALIGFGDKQQLEKEMDSNIKVELPEFFEADMDAGFNWLDLAVSYGDKNALKYFRLRIQEDSFRQAFCEYCKHRPDNHLERHADISPGFFSGSLRQSSPNSRDYDRGTHNPAQSSTLRS